MQSHSIPELIEQMTLAEKASLCSGAEMFATAAIDRLCLHGPDH